MKSRKSPTPRGETRRGYTMLELLVASIVTALVAASSATFLSATTNASLTTRDVRTAQQTGHYTLAQFGKAIREARAVGQVTASTITLWVGDFNGDDKLNLYETAIVRFDAVEKQLFFDYLAIPQGGMPTTTVTTNDFTNATNLAARMPSADKRTVTWCTNVPSLGFSGKPSGTDARMIELTFNLDISGQSVAFRGSGNARASADYLFYSQTQTSPPIGSGRKHRKEISRWDGYSTIVGGSTALNLN